MARHMLFFQRRLFKTVPRQPKSVIKQSQAPPNIQNPERHAKKKKKTIKTESKTILQAKSKFRSLIPADTGRRELPQKI